jgi:hypothetical protein
MIHVDQKQLENVKYFKYLLSLLTKCNEVWIVMVKALFIVMLNFKFTLNS